MSCEHPVPCNHHLRLKSSKSNTSHQQDGGAMLRASANRGLFVRAVCVLCVALVCVMGTLQATHSHPENSSTSHHACSICAYGSCWAEHDERYVGAGLGQVGVVEFGQRTFPDFPSRCSAVYSSSTRRLILLRIR